MFTRVTTNGQDQPVAVRVELPVSGRWEEDSCGLLPILDLAGMVQMSRSDP
jgi:hypothetical protein